MDLKKPHRAERRMALSLDGTDDYGTLGTLDASGWSAITLSAWVWSDTGGEIGSRCIVGSGIGEIGLWWDNGRPAISVGTTGGTATTLDLSPGFQGTKYNNMPMCMVAHWESGSAANLWHWTQVYGWTAHDTTSGSPSGTINATSTMTLGRQAASASQFWKGRIWEAQVWNALRSEEQLKGSIRRTHPAHPDLQGHWQAQILADLSDSSAKTPANGDENLSGTPSTLWKLFDLSGNGHHAGLNGLPSSGALNYSR